MMRYKKKELLKIVSSLGEVNHLIIENAEHANTDSIMEALRNCQESAITIGTYLEGCYEEKTAGSVHMLEDYCEVVYQMSLALDNPNQIKKLAKKVQKQLFQKIGRAHV